MKNYEKEEVKDFSKGKPLGVWIGNLGKYNEGELVGAWVRFPTTPAEIDSVMKKIGIGTRDVFGQPYEETFIGDYDCYVKGMSQYLGEYESLDELNYLTERITEMTDAEFETFVAAIEMGDNLLCTKDLINLTFNLEEYDFFPDIDSDKKLGCYWIDEFAPETLEQMGSLMPYFDYEAYGRDVRISEGGVFTEHGYISNRDNPFEEVYSGERKDIPSEYLVYPRAENYLENAEVLMEDDYGMIDGIINNGPKESVMEKLKAAEEKCAEQPAREKERKKEEICL